LGSLPTDLAVVLLLAVDDDLDLVGTLHDVVVGDDVALAVDDEAGAQALLGRVHLRSVEEMLEEVVEEGDRAATAG
jgi:hypothetical protein